MVTASDIAQLRLQNQRISGPLFEQPYQAVAWLGAVQAQDYASVRWAVGLRCHRATEIAIEQAIATQTIIRTWLMRGTLHLAAAADVRWLLSLLGPRLMTSGRHRHRQLGLDPVTFARANDAITGALHGGRPLTRAEIMLALEQAGISAAGQRGYHLLRQAALAGLICFGPVQNKKETFVLLDDWAPQSITMAPDAALAELARRYFGSRGPATLPDFSWWSGLPASMARAALDLAQAGLQHQVIAGQDYWLPAREREPAPGRDPSPAVHLLPAFDEYYLGYKVRDAVLDARYDQRVVSSNGIFRPVIVSNGQVKGIWYQTQKKGAVIITPAPFEPLTGVEQQALVRAANRYGAFRGLPVTLV